MFLPEAALLRIATISRRPLFFSTVNCRLLSEGSSEFCVPEKQSTYRRTLLTNSITRRRSRCGCFAFARRQAKRSSSKSWEQRLRRVPLRLPKLMQRSKQSSSRKQLNWLRSTEPNCSKKRSRDDSRRSIGLTVDWDSC